MIHRPPLLQDQWAAAMTLRTVLLSIQVLTSPLIIPECNLSLCRPCWPPRSLMTLRTLWWRGSTRKISQSLKRPLNIGPPRLRALLTKYCLIICMMIILMSNYLQNPDFDKMLRQLRDMGVEEGAARVALSSCAWDMQKATEQLFN